MRKAKLKIWAVGLWIVIWQAAAMIVGRDFLLASPLESISRFFQLSLTADFWLSALRSLFRIFGGFLLGTLAGTGMAALSCAFAWVNDLLAPVMAVLRAIPVASFVVVALIWLPSRNLPVLIAFLIVLPLIYGAVCSEIAGVDPKMIEMSRIFRMSRSKRLIYIYALSGARGFSAACTTAMGLAWKSGVAAELIAIPSGSIGERLYQAKVYLMTGDLFAWTILIVLLSALCAKFFAMLIRAGVSALERM